MNTRLILVVSLLAGLAAGFVAGILGFGGVVGQIATVVVTALMIGVPWSWWQTRKDKA